MKTLIRTFHPVGFGAFYTEEHEVMAKRFRIVFDCGSMTFNDRLESYVQNVFPPDSTIDILFISHFDRDHINGVGYLKKYYEIKTVVIPYIYPGDRLLYVSAKGDIGDFTDLVTNTEAYFGPDTKIIRVLSEAQDNILQNNAETLMRSGEAIKYNDLSIYWKYIPFNYDFAKFVVPLKDEIIKQGLDCSLLADQTYITDNISRIKKAYKNLKSNMNDTSLILFSGTDNFSSIFHLYRSNIGFIITFSGLNCIYYGDSNTKKDGFIDLLRRRIKGLWDTVSTVQVPHHGSKKNFKSDIITKNTLSVISCNPKRYGHPSPKVLDGIAKAGGIALIVTDSIDSIFREYGFFR